jgi:hypothetical protein
MKKIVAIITLFLICLSNLFSQGQETIKLQLTDVMVAKDTLLFKLQYSNLSDTAVMMYNPSRPDDICAAIIRIYFFDRHKGNAFRYEPCVEVVDLNSITLSSSNSVCVAAKGIVVNQHHYLNAGFEKFCGRKNVQYMYGKRNLFSLI